MAVGQLREGLGAYLERALSVAAEDLEEGDLPPTPAALQAFHEHFSTVEAESSLEAPVPQPHLCLPGNGDISLEWSEADRRLYMSVFSDGLIRLFRATVRDSRAADSSTVSGPSPREVVAALQWIAGVR